jgi:hypothetical protein
MMSAPAAWPGQGNLVQSLHKIGTFSWQTTNMKLE